MSKEWSRHGPGHPAWDLQSGLCLCPERTNHGKGEQYTGTSIWHAVVSPGCLRQSCIDSAQPCQGLCPSASSSPNHSLPWCPSGPFALQVPPSPSPVYLEPLFCVLPALAREAVRPLRLSVLHQAGVR